MRQLILSVIFLVLPASRLPAQHIVREPDPAAALLILGAQQSRVEGSFSASILCVRESYLGGRDTLHGTLDVLTGGGERRLVLRPLQGSETVFEWWSRSGGREQWHRDGSSGRLRRLPPHSLKKPSFAPTVSFLDLSRLPFGYLDGFRFVRRVGETDSTRMLKMVPDTGLSALYDSLELTFARDPDLLRRVVFTGKNGRPGKSMEIVRYAREEGRSFPAEIRFLGEDGLSSVRLTLEWVRSGGGPVRDKTDVGASTAPFPPFAAPRWLPRGPDGNGEDGEDGEGREAELHESGR